MAHGELALEGHGTAGHSRFTPIHAGMIAFLLSEVAFFGTLIMSYVYFLRQTQASVPAPKDVFHLFEPPFVTLISTVFLLSSSGTIHFAEKALHGGSVSSFLRWFGLTILLGALFIGGTAWEWAELIGHHKLTISRNMFGSAYFTLVGFHAAHVTVGLILMIILFSLFAQKKMGARNTTGVEVVSWYWHFVDVVWIVVFSLVYVIGR